MKKRNNKFYKPDLKTKIKIIIEYILFLILLIIVQTIKGFPIFDVQSFILWITLQESSEKLSILYPIIVLLLLIVYPLYIAVTYNIDAQDKDKKPNPYLIIFTLIPLIVGVIMLIQHFF